MALREIFAEYSIQFDKKHALDRGAREVTGLKSDLTTLRPTVTSTTRALDRFSDAARNIEFDKKHELKQGTRTISTLRSRLTALRPTILAAASAFTGLATAAGAGAIAGLRGIISNTVESTREISRWTNRLQISEGNLRSWIELGREYGASVDDVTDGLKELQLKAQDAASGGTAQAEMFERIGISINDLRPYLNDSNALFELFTRQLDKVNDVGLRNFTIDELMSDAGTRLLGVFNLGSREISRRREEISRTIGPTEGLTRTITEHARHVIRITRAWERFQREVTSRVLPIVNDLLSKIVDFEEPLRKAALAVLDVARETNLLKGALIGVGAVVAAVGIATIGTWGPIAAIVAGAAVAVGAVAVGFDQVTSTIEGSDTMLRKFLDDSRILGAGGTTGLVLLLNDAWAAMPGILNDISRGARRTYNNINRMLTQLGPVSTVLQTILDIVLAFPRQSILGRLFTWVRGAAQARNTQEVQTTSAATRDRMRSLSAEGERLDRWSGRAVDAAGQPLSLDLQAVDVVSSGDQVSPTPRSERPAQQISIDAPTNMTLNITEATNGEEFARIARREVDAGNRRLISEVDSMRSQQTEAQ